MDWTIKLDQKIREYLPELKVLHDEPMSRHTFFRIGGNARRMALPTTTEQTVLLLSFAEECGARPLVIGNGTNLLVSDQGVDRLVVDTSAALHRLELQADHTLFAEAGVPLARLADFAAKNNLTGLEFAHGIPGTVGGAVCMNAGAYDGEIKQVIVGATVLFPQEGVRFLSAEELRLSYRHSIISERPDAVVLSAVFRLDEGEEAAIREKMRELMDRRKKSQPLEYPSAGSTFKRPAGHFAGTLIQECGLKGMTVGGARVSEKHAGFIINVGGATCADVTALIRRVQDTVFEKTGVRLEPEVRIVE